MLAALLRSLEGVPVGLYEKRHGYTRTRMVQLAPYLTWRTRLRRTVPTTSTRGHRRRGLRPGGARPGSRVPAVHLPELMALLRDWEQGFCPLNEIEVALSDLIGSSGSKGVQRTEIEVTAEDAKSMIEPGDVLVDCTGSNSLLETTWRRAPATGWRSRAQHSGDPAGVRAGDHLPVQPDLRMQRVLQVLQERREPALRSSFRSSTAPTTTAASPT